MTTAALAAHLLRRVEIAQGRMDDCLDWSEPAEPMDGERAEKLRRERAYDRKRRKKARAERRAKAETGWHKIGRAQWKRRQGDARNLAQKG